MTIGRRTPLHGCHSGLGARFVDFAGWEMPVFYAGIIPEHRAVRSAAGLFDVSHMGEAVVRGERAGAFLDHVLTNSISGLAPGRVIYSPMCVEDGGAIDDLLVYRRPGGDWLLCLNASNTGTDLDWLRERAGPFGVEVEDQSAETALLALQGPKAAEILSKAGAESLEALFYYHCEERRVAGVDCLLSRTGYTGEDGFELFCGSGHAAGLWETLLRAGEPLGLVPAGLGARDSLRLEAGMPLYGHELSREITPVQAGLGWTVKLRKPGGFVGRDALEREKRDGPARRVIHFHTADRRILRPDTQVLEGDQAVGRVLSGTFSPVLEVAIGSALVAAPAADRPLAADVRGNRVAVNRIRPPFVPHRVYRPPS
ncbi:MAG: glycine cleavage system aminomethyltransferase GcvT [Puniceicoccaceae bacterium]|nr:MAG: glycine cleavage system aminomethyltransferase GcvT [Puniceicoccaceae bacterium]